MRERTPFPAATLDRLPDLKLLITTGMGNVAIDIAAAQRNGVVVCGTGMHGPATAELAWGLILALARKIPAEDADMRARRLADDDRRPTSPAPRSGWSGSARLGKRMVPVAKAFGMDVVAWSTNLDPEEARAAGAEPVAKDELFERSDFVSVHYKLSERSRGLIGAAELALMKPSAFLVNTSRGPIVDTDALLDALEAGTIAGAGLDVYDTEPLPADHPLRSAPHTILTPHLGYVTEDTYTVFFDDAVEDVLAYLAGEPVRVLEP